MHFYSEFNSDPSAVIGPLLTRSTGANVGRDAKVRLRCWCSLLASALDLDSMNRSYARLFLDFVGAVTVRGFLNDSSIRVKIPPMAELRIGTSSFTAAGWKGTFYPSGMKSPDFLAY